MALVAPFGLRPKGTTLARVLPIAEVLAADGVQVRVVVPPWDDPGRSGQAWSRRGVEVVHTHVGLRPLSPLVVLWGVLSLVRRFEPDVVHAFKPIGYSGAAALWFRRRGRARRNGAPQGRFGEAPDRAGPVVVVDADDIEGPLGWAGRRRMGVEGWLRGLQERRTLREAQGVTVASAWLRRYARGLGVPDDRIYTLPNGYADAPQHGLGIPALEPMRSNAEVGPDGPTILWYTRFTEADPDRAAGLLAPLLREDAGWCLAILGEEITPGAEARLGRAFVEAGVGPRIRWLGYDPSAAVRIAAGGGAPVVAIYPLDDDPANRARCPSKIPQLMALGLPVVAERVGEVGAYLEGFEEECLVPPGDAPAFQERVTFLLRNPEARDGLAARLRLAARRWRWDRTAAGLAEWYWQLTRGRAAPVA